MLHPDLKARLKTVDGMVFIHHPLIVSIYFDHEQEDERNNKCYEWKLKEVAKANAEKCWDRYVFMHERPYRLDAFIVIMRHLDGPAYWSLLSDIWTDAEGNSRNIKYWKKLFKAKMPHPECIMNDEELKVYRSLPDKVTIYRGYTKGLNRNGLSYSLSKEKAEWFARRFYPKKAGLITLTVDKSSIVAYFNGRNEEEIIYLG